MFLKNAGSYTLDLLTLVEHTKDKCGLTERRKGIYSNIIFGTVIFVTTWFLTAMKGILFEGIHTNSSTPFTVGYPANLSTMYGVAPIICLAFGFYSSLALMLHTLVFFRVNCEWEIFNEDLASSERLQQLTIPIVLRKFSSRQIELMELVKVINQNMSESILS
ncbi:hypothetical protein COOONC_20635 [Cooperia oncophora]